MRILALAMFCFVGTAAYAGDSLNEYLVIASKNGDISKVTELLSRGADINFITQGENIVTPLIAAILESQELTATFLLSKGANPNIGVTTDYFRSSELKGTMGVTTPLNLAIYLGYNKLIGDLISSGANVNANGGTALFMAIFKGDARAFQTLIAAGAQIDQKFQTLTPYAYALAKNQIKMAEILSSIGAPIGSINSLPSLISEEAYLNLLSRPDVTEDWFRSCSNYYECESVLTTTMAARNFGAALKLVFSRFPAVRRDLIRIKVGVRSAIESNAIDALKILVPLFSDMNVLTPPGDYGVFNIREFLIRKKSTTAFQIFIDNGLDPNIPGYCLLGGTGYPGVQALPCALDAGADLEFVKFLVTHGASLRPTIPPQSDQSFRPGLLRLSVERSSLEVTEFLLSNGADPNVIGDDKNFALEALIRRENSNKWADLLLKHGAKFGNEFFSLMFGSYANDTLRDHLFEKYPEFFNAHYKLDGKEWLPLQYVLAHSEDANGDQNRTLWAIDHLADESFFTSLLPTYETGWPDFRIACFSPLYAAVHFHEPPVSETLIDKARELSVLGKLDFNSWLKQKTPDVEGCLFENLYKPEFGDTRKARRKARVEYNDRLKVIEKSH